MWSIWYHKGCPWKRYSLLDFFLPKKEYDVRSAEAAAVTFASTAAAASRRPAMAEMNSNSEVKRNKQNIDESGLAAAAVAYYEKEDMNCAESLLRACSDFYGLHLDGQALLAASGFGGGMGIQSVCGALTGALMAMGPLFVENRAHESDVLKEICEEFFGSFEQEHGTILCSVLKDRYHTEKAGCRETVRIAAEFTEAFIEQKRHVRIR